MIIAVLHGSNLNRLGVRRPEKYGTTTLAQITADVDATAVELGVTALHHQSNWEGSLVDWIHAHSEQIDGIVLNPAGFSSVGYPLLDAVRDCDVPFAVVHISQFLALDGKAGRADIFADTATTYVSGAGWRGYSLALRAVVHRLRDGA